MGIADVRLGIRSLVSKLERRALSQHGLGLVCVAAASLVQHEAGEEAKAGAAPFLCLHDDTDRRLAFFREEREEGDNAGRAAATARAEPAAYGSR